MSLSPTLYRWLYRLRNTLVRVRGWKQELAALAGLGFLAELDITLVRRDGTRVPLGLVSRRVVTTAGATAVADAFMNTFELENFNFHDSGTNGAAEAVGDTALGAAAGPARVSGTQSKPSATQYRSVGTITYTTSQTIQEHGLFSASSGGTLLDRTQFTGIAVINGDSIQFTYTLTINAGG